MSVIYQQLSHLLSSRIQDGTYIVLSVSSQENGSFHRLGHKNSPNQRVPVGVENVVSRFTTNRRLSRILDVGYPEIVWPILALDFLGLSCCSGFHALVEIGIRLPHLRARSCVFVCISCYRFPDERLRLPDALELGIVGEISIVLDTTFIIGFDLAITLSSSPAPS